MFGTTVFKIGNRSAQMDSTMSKGQNLEPKIMPYTNSAAQRCSFSYEIFTNRQFDEGKWKLRILNCETFYTYIVALSELLQVW